MIFNFEIDEYGLSEVIIFGYSTRLKTDVIILSFCLKAVKEKCNIILINLVHLMKMVKRELHQI